MNLQLQNLDLRYEECPSFDSLPLSFGTTYTSRGKFSAAISSTRDVPRITTAI